MLCAIVGNMTKSKSQNFINIGYTIFSHKSDYKLTHMVKQILGIVLKSVHLIYK